MTGPGGLCFGFSAPEMLRQMLLEGCDEIQLTLGRKAQIDGFRQADRVRRPWAY